jgi:hypothetical protein
MPNGSTATSGKCTSPRSEETAAQALRGRLAGPPEVRRSCRRNQLVSSVAMTVGSPRTTARYPSTKNIASIVAARSGRGIAENPKVAALFP